MNDPRGHLYGQNDQPHEPPISPDVLSTLPTDPASRRRALAADSRWLYAVDLFNWGYYCVKIREGKANGVARHTQRARELFGDLEAAPVGRALGLAPEGVTAVVAELEKFTPVCWHTTPTPVIRVLDAGLWLAG